MVRNSMPLGEDASENMFEGMFEGVYEDAGAPRGKDGALPSFDASRFENAKAMKTALEDLRRKLQDSLQQLQREERTRVRWWQDWAKMRKRAVARKLQGEKTRAVNSYLEELRDKGELTLFVPDILEEEEERVRKRAETRKRALRRAAKGAYDMAEHLSRIEEIDSKCSSELSDLREQARKQEQHLRGIESEFASRLEERKAGITEKAEREIATIHKATKKSRKQLQNRLEAIPEFLAERRSAIRELEEKDDPQLEGFLNPGHVASRKRYLAKPEFRDYMTRAKHKELAVFTSISKPGWIIIGLVMIAIGAVVFSQYHPVLILGFLTVVGGPLMGLGVTLFLVYRKVRAVVRQPRVEEEQESD